MSIQFVSLIGMLVICRHEVEFSFNAATHPVINLYISLKTIIHMSLKTALFELITYYYYLLTYLLTYSMEQSPS